MFLFAIFIVFFSTFIWHIELVDKQTDEDTQAVNVLNEACRSALAEAEIDSARVFAKEEVRQAALNKFKESFNYGFQKVGYKRNDIEYMVPFIMLVDDDGYYINYSKLVNNGTLSELVNTTSLKQNWDKIYGNYIVSYHLSNVVEVTYVTTGKITRGTYSDVYKAVGEPVALSFMSDAKSFREEKNASICSITEENVNYYITTHNEYKNRDQRRYKFVMPVDDNTSARLMDEPSVIAFVQSSQSSTMVGYTNAYSLTGATLTDAIDYYEYVDASGNKYYHLKSCKNLVLSENNGTPKTMDDCAADGYVPCPDCIK